jgi:hypothetical protein
MRTGIGVFPGKDPVPEFKWLPAVAVLSALRPYRALIIAIPDSFRPMGELPLT